MFLEKKDLRVKCLVDIVEAGEVKHSGSQTVLFEVFDSLCAC